MLSSVDAFVWTWHDSPPVESIHDQVIILSNSDCIWHRHSVLIQTSVAAVDELPMIPMILMECGAVRWISSTPTFSEDVLHSAWPSPCLNYELVVPFDICKIIIGALSPQSVAQRLSWDHPWSWVFFSTLSVRPLTHWSARCMWGSRGRGTRLQPT